MKMHRFWIVIIFFLFPGLSGQGKAADVPSEKLAAAGEAYAAENWAEAVRLYEELVATGYQSAELQYNLGNAYYRQNASGPAVLAYLRALRLAPGDRDARHNLELILDGSRNEIFPIPPFFLWRAWRGMFQWLPGRAWGLMSLFLLYVGMAGLIGWLLWRKSDRRRRAFWAGFFALGLALLCYFLQRARYDFDTNPAPAVLLANQATLYSAADIDSPAIREVYSGLVVRIEDQIGDMYKVVLRNGEEGWLESGTVERVVEK